MIKIKIPTKSDSSENRSFILSLLIKFLIFGISMLCLWKFSDTYAISIIFCVFFGSTISVSLIFYFFKKDRINEIKPIIENITTDFIHGLELPITITNELGNIVWYNDAFYEYFAVDKYIFNENVSNILNTQIAYDMVKNKNKNFSSEFDFKDKKFIINRYHISSNSSELDILMFKDWTEIHNLRNEINMKDPVIAYIVVDNMSEIAQTMQNKYRSASGAVSDLLKSWTVKNCGVIKEYEKDKYLCFFENKSLKIFEKNKFSILDDVRDIKIEDMGIPVTISAGISGIKGTMSEKDAIAQQALDLALQRGGDQAVVKGVQSIEFYGGKTKTVQKKTKIRSRVVATQLRELMRNSENILIMGHKFADNDSIGASVGIARFALSIGVKPNIIVNIHDKNLKSSFMKLRGLQDYKDIFVDSVTANDLIKSTTSLIVVDVNNSRYFEAEEIYKIVPRVAIIDHHRKTTEFICEPVISYIEPSCSSASELIAEILEQSLSPGELLKEEAELLLAGIILDTKQFSRNTGTRTFSAALYLRGEGANPSEALSIFKTGLDEFVREAKFESNVMIYRDCMAMSVLPTEATNEDKTAGAKAADKMLSIDGVSASFALFRAGDTVHISARSLGTVNVQLILEALGGGGHYDVAGAQVKNTSIRDVLVLLKKNIDEYFDGA